MQKGKCCICKEEYTNYGNNANPIKDGRCCNWCDDNLVIPLRIHLYIVNKK